jgi:hypothetical protein
MNLVRNREERGSAKHSPEKRVTDWGGPRRIVQTPNIGKIAVTRQVPSGFGSVFTSIAPAAIEDRPGVNRRATREVVWMDACIVVILYFASRV